MSKRETADSESEPLGKRSRREEKEDAQAPASVSPRLATEMSQMVRAQQPIPTQQVQSSELGTNRLQDELIRSILRQQLAHAPPPLSPAPLPHPNPQPAPVGDTSALLQSLISHMQKTSTWGNQPNIAIAVPATQPCPSIQQAPPNRESELLANLFWGFQLQHQQQYAMPQPPPHIPPPPTSAPSSNLTALLASLLGASTLSSMQLAPLAAPMPAAAPSNQDILNSLGWVQQPTTGATGSTTQQPRDDARMTTSNFPPATTSNGQSMTDAASVLSSILSSGSYLTPQALATLSAVAAAAASASRPTDPVFSSSFAAAALGTGAAAASVDSRTAAVGRGRVMPLSLPTDSNYLSEYQVLLREQIDLFEATEADLMARAQGRNKPLRLHSIGIRCRHCEFLHPGFRPRGAVYFPTKLTGLYHSSQNMAANHFSGACRNTPEPIATRLAALRQSKAVVYGRGSQRYWEMAAEKMGVGEEEGRLILADSATSSSTVTTTTTTTTTSSSSRGGETKKPPAKKKAPK